MEPGSTNQPKPSQPTPAPRKKRTWRFWLLTTIIALLVIIIVFAALIPVWVSTRAGTRLIVGQINGSIKGHVSIGRLSTSWGGATTLEDLVLLDPQGREVLNASRATYSGGVWQLIRNAIAFKELTIQSPRAILYVQPDGTLSISQALEARKPSAPKPSKPPTAAKQFLDSPKTISLTDGMVRVIQPEGQSYQLDNLTVNIAVQAGQVVEVQTSLRTPEKSEITGRGQASNLLDSRGELQLAKADVRGELRSAQPIELAPISQVAKLQPKVAGRGNIDGTADIRGGRGIVKLTCELIDVKNPDVAEAKPMTVGVGGTVNFTPELIDGSLVIKGDVGNLDTSFQYPRGAQFPRIDWLSAVLTGKDVAMPQFKATVKDGKLDLPRLEQSLPGMLRLQKDVKLTSGILQIPLVELAGGDSPTAKGSIALTELRGRRGDKDVSLKPIENKFDMAMQPNVGLNVAQMQVTTGFGKLDAKGPAQGLAADYNFDLQAMTDQLRELFDLGQFKLAGQLAGSLKTKKDGDDISIEQSATATDLRLESAGKSLAIARANYMQSSVARLQDGKLARVTTNAMRLDVDKALAVSGSGWYDNTAGSLQYDGKIEKCDLEQIGQWGKALGMAELARYGGSATGSATLSRAGADKPLLCAGNVNVQKVTVDGQSIAPQADELNIVLKQGQLSPYISAGEVTAELGAPKGAAGDKVLVFIAQSLTLKQGAAAGHYTVAGQMKPAMAAVALVAKAKDFPQFAGRLAGSGNFSTQSSQFTAAGKLGIDDLAMQRGKDSFAEKRVDLNYDVSADSNTKNMNLKAVKFDSQTLMVGATGTITDYTSQQVLDLTVDYRGSWERMTNILHQLVPATKDTITLVGEPADKFKVTGPFSQPTVIPVYRGVAARPTVTWKTAQLYGLELGDAKLQPQLANGRLIVPPTVIPGSAGGRVNLAMEVDLGKQPMLSIPGKVRVFEDLAVNAKVGQYILSRVNPILGQVAQLEGKINLQTEDFSLPLDSSINKGGGGRGRLDLSELRVVPRGMLGQIARMTGAVEAGAFAMHVEAVDFVVKDGRINYDNFVISIAGTKLKFRGSVGFDDSVEMYMSIPVSANVLKTFNVVLPPGVGLDRVAKALEGTNIEIPIKGNRLAPTLDLAAVNMGKLVQQALKNITTGGGGLLQGLPKLP